MFKFLLFLLFAVVSSNAFAEWVVVGRNDKATIYIDQQPSHILNNVVKMRTLFDFKIARKGLYSLIMKSEYDCKDKQTRASIDYYYGRMGQGKKSRRLSGEEMGKWMPVAPHTFGNAVWKYACGIDTQLPFANPF